MASTLMLIAALTTGQVPSYPVCAWDHNGHGWVIHQPVYYEQAGPCRPSRETAPGGGWQPSTQEPGPREAVPPASEVSDPNVVTVLTDTGGSGGNIGNGFVVASIQEYSLVLTSAYLLPGAYGYQVTFSDGSCEDAELISADPEIDAALLAVEDRRARRTTVVFAEEPLQQGQRLTWLGYHYRSPGSHQARTLRSATGTCDGYIGYRMAYRSSPAPSDTDAGSPIISPGGCVVAMVSPTGLNGSVATTAQVLQDFIRRSLASWPGDEEQQAACGPAHESEQPEPAEEVSDSTGTVEQAGLGIAQRLDKVESKLLEISETPPPTCPVPQPAQVDYGRVEKLVEKHIDLRLVEIREEPLSDDELDRIADRVIARLPPQRVEYLDGQGRIHREFSYQADEAIQILPQRIKTRSLNGKEVEATAPLGEAVGLKPATSLLSPRD